MNQSPELLVSNWTLNLDRSLKKNSIRFLEKLKIGKPQGLRRFPQKYGRPDNSTTYCSDNATHQNLIDRWMKGCILPFPKKGDLGLAKNYRGIILKSIAAKIYNALLQNRIEPKMKNILRKTKMASKEIDSRPHKYWPSVAFMSMHTKLNTCALIKQTTFPH